MSLFDSNGLPLAESSAGNPYGYQGRRWDKESGLWYYRNRMYSPELGRFLQRDPSGYVDGCNLYAFLQNNPLRYLDAMGLTSRQGQEELGEFREEKEYFQIPYFLSKSEYTEDLLKNPDLITDAFIKMYNVGVVIHEDVIDFINWNIKRQQIQWREGDIGVLKLDIERTLATGRALKEGWEYFSQTSFKQKLRDLGNTLTKSETWDRILATSLEIYLLNKAASRLSSFGAADEAGQAASKSVARNLESRLGRRGVGKPKWPRNPSEMNKMLQAEGSKIPDTPNTPGRGKIVWQPSDKIKITYEQHPYDTNAPAFHKEGHWHLDSPGISPHQRFLPGEEIPGF